MHLHHTHFVFNKNVCIASKQPSRTDGKKTFTFTRFFLTLK